MDDCLQPQIYSDRSFYPQLVIDLFAQPLDGYGCRCVGFRSLLVVSRGERMCCVWRFVARFPTTKAVGLRLRLPLCVFPVAFGGFSR